MKGLLISIRPHERTILCSQPFPLPLKSLKLCGADDCSRSPPMFRSLHSNFSVVLSGPLPRAARARMLSPAKCSAGAIAHLSATPSADNLSTIPRPWSGLQNWRENPINDKLIWGPDGPLRPPVSDHSTDNLTEKSVASLAEYGALVLHTSDPQEKARISHLAFERWICGELPVGESQPPDRPARPTKPSLAS